MREKQHGTCPRPNSKGIYPRPKPYSWSRDSEYLLCGFFGQRILYWAGSYCCVSANGALVRQSGHGAIDAFSSPKAFGGNISNELSACAAKETAALNGFRGCRVVGIEDVVRLKASLVHFSCIVFRRVCKASNKGAFGPNHSNNLLCRKNQSRPCMDACSPTCRLIHTSLLGYPSLWLQYRILSLSQT